MQTLLIVIYVITALLLILIILLQSKKAAGMGLFGGSETILGSSGADILTKITAILAIIFVVIAFSISLIMVKKKTGTEIEIEKMMQEQAPAQNTPADSVSVPGLQTNQE